MYDLKVEYSSRSEEWIYNATYYQIEGLEGSDGLREVSLTSRGIGLETLQRGLEQDSLELGHELWDVLRQAESVDRRPSEKADLSGDGKPAG